MQLREEVSEIAAGFVQMVSRSKEEFDYSIDSLQQLDYFVKSLCNNNFTDDEFYGVCKFTGSYVFEVLHRELGGRFLWTQKGQQPVLVIGEPDFTIQVKAWQRIGMCLHTNMGVTVSALLDELEVEMVHAQQKSDYKMVIE